jgi:hypothetical protein
MRGPSAVAIADILFFFAALGSLARAEFVSVELVSINQAGNTADTTGYGSVGYEYRIGRYEVTNSQYVQFLNSVATADDPYSLWELYMQTSPEAGILRSGAPGSYVYELKSDEWANRPVNYVTLWDAARFVNWLHNGQGDGDTENGAYHGIGDVSTFGRNANARFFLPTVDEWYKAAYYDPSNGLYYDYPTATDAPPSNDITVPDAGNNANFRIDIPGTNDDDYTLGPPYRTTPVGGFENSASPYGTFDQGGNLWEWTETKTSEDQWVSMGGAYYTLVGALNASNPNSRMPRGPTLEGTITFRVAAASAPEPATVWALVAMLLTGVALWRKKPAA